jgi:hypothetical protein
MRDLFYKFMPWIFGFLLGWMLWSPPVWLRSLGPASYAVNLLLCGLLLLSVIAWLILANFPARLTMDPVAENEVHPELRALGERIAALGFRPAGPPWRVNVAPSAILLGFVHENQPVYATAFRTEHVKAKMSFDFVSLIHGDRGGLTTNPSPDGAVLPTAPGEMRQVFPDEEPEKLYQRHLQGIAYLRERGVACRAVSGDMLQQDFTAAIARQRGMFLSSPLVFTAVTLWRSATKQIPFAGSLRDQRVAGEQISRILASS